jgi:hypothetical protein
MQILMLLWTGILGFEYVQLTIRHSVLCLAGQD